METLLPFLIAAVAAIAILLIFVGLAGGSPVDPVQARLTQLGTMQAKNLEELELQQPFFERTLRPLAQRLSGATSRMASTSFTATDREAPRARRQPRRPARRRLARASRPSAPSSAALLFVLLFVIIGVLDLPPVLRLAMIADRAGVRLHDPRVLARRPRPEAPEGRSCS